MEKKKSEAVEFLERLGGGPLTFGRLIRSVRLGEEESLEVFAERLGLSRQNLSDIEHGRRGVSVERAAEWAEILGYGPEQFVELAVQAQLDAAGLEMRASLSPRLISARVKGAGRAHGIAARRAR
jgi:transcriptional regulator with XRE-family HTH domain